MSEENKDTIITQFQDITGQDIEKSKFYLESSGWNLEIALGSFYETETINNSGVHISTYSVIIRYGIVISSGGKDATFKMVPKLFHLLD